MLCYETEIGGLKIKLRQTTRGLFVVTYGKQTKADLSYGAAAHYFGECLFHALTCDGKIETED